MVSGDPQVGPLGSLAARAPARTTHGAAPSALALHLAIMPNRVGTPNRKPASREGADRGRGVEGGARCERGGGRRRSPGARRPWHAQPARGRGSRQRARRGGARGLHAVDAGPWPLRAAHPPSYSASLSAVMTGSSALGGAPILASTSAGSVSGTCAWRRRGLVVHERAKRWWVVGAGRGVSVAGGGGWARPQKGSWRGTGGISAPCRACVAKRLVVHPSTHLVQVGGGARGLHARLHLLRQAAGWGQGSSAARGVREGQLAAAAAARGCR